MVGSGLPADLSPSSPVRPQYNMKGGKLPVHVNAHPYKRSNWSHRKADVDLTRAEISANDPAHENSPAGCERIPQIWWQRWWKS